MGASPKDGRNKSKQGAQKIMWEEFTFNSHSKRDEEKKKHPEKERR